MMQESRIAPCFEFLARAYEYDGRSEDCARTLARGLRFLADERVFKVSFDRALNVYTKPAQWTHGTLCQRLFALVDAPSSSTSTSIAAALATHPLPVDRLILMTTELNRWRAAKRSTIEEQRTLLTAMQASPDLTPEQETWIAVEKISTDYVAAGAANTEEKYAELINQLNRYIVDGSSCWSLVVCKGLVNVSGVILILLHFVWLIRILLTLCFFNASGILMFLTES